MILLLLAFAAAAPQPAELKTFRDWTVGCDNGKSCHAVALVPESWPDDALTMSVRRAPEAGAPPVLAFALGADSGAATIVVDGRKLPIRLMVKDESVAVASADTEAMIEMLRHAGRLQVLAADDKSLGTVSLDGASAALLYIDEQQRRVGTAGALVRRGTRPAIAIPTPTPVVTARPITSAPPLAMNAAAIRALRRKHGCTIDEVGGPDEAETAALARGETLLLLACGSGAYNVSHVPFVLRRGAGGVRAELAAFDVQPGWWAEEGKPMLTNAAWDKSRGLMTSASWGRGLGDCGVTAQYAWDGSRFRLVEQAEMSECRGSRDFITTWRARVVRR